MRPTHPGLITSASHTHRALPHIHLHGFVQLTRLHLPDLWLASHQHAASTHLCRQDQMPVTLTSAELEDVLQFSIELARKAGTVILEGSKAIRRELGSAVDTKKNSVDLVTEWDVKVENLVRKDIAEKYPSFGL